jgi:hypothetical protein
MKRNFLLLTLLASPAFSQSANLGLFTSSGDIGSPAKKGATAFNASTGQYKITGSGANIWARQDQFQYVWKEMTGNFTMTATVEFLGKGEEHRKAGIMLRQTQDTDSVYGDFLVHGSGMPAIQWRSNKGEDTNSFDFPFDSPGKFKLKLVRNGVGLVVSIAKNGGEMKDIGRTEVRFASPFMLGLVVCAHNADALETVIFSDVTIEPLAPPAGAKKQ